VVGRRVGPFAGRVDAELVRRYAAATGDPSPRVRAGAAVPAVAIATRVWDAQDAARDRLLSAELLRSGGGVHGEHDVVVHRPIVPGEPLRTWVEGWGAQPAGRNVRAVLHYVTEDAAGAAVAEQWWTTVYLGAACPPSGEPAPDHAFPDEARARVLGEHAVDVDEGMARRYAEASGDWSAHHFDAGAARRSGADRPFLHGLCTMALCARAVTAVAAGGDPERVWRVAVRFARPVPLGERLVVRVHDAGALGLAFEAECAGVAVVTHGRAELRPAQRPRPGDPGQGA
jgi:acyl dehydratase